MTQVYQTKLGEGRRMAIPVEVCQKLQIRPGDPLLVEVREDGLYVKTLEQVIGEIQQTFARYQTQDQSEVEELIRQRRQESTDDRSTLNV